MQTGQEVLGLTGQAIDGLGQCLGAPHHPNGPGAGLGRGPRQQADRIGHHVGLTGHLTDMPGDLAGRGILLLHRASDGR
ncbi:hypothetical protein A6A05_08965 [Magnetospirillum moscoviense]|uniref:Uncharacterized protein n=1 Tax=Magnetospirillum moscoviense TaxID=1437059 RepID=A0A178MV57_9PROT|nr:hypothetical protein A6A05_08965 [Magnetospirillum moscoviense]